MAERMRTVAILLAVFLVLPLGAARHVQYGLGWQRTQEQCSMDAGHRGPSCGVAVYCTPTFSSGAACSRPPLSCTESVSPRAVRRSQDREPHIRTRLLLGTAWRLPLELHAGGTRHLSVLHKPPLCRTPLFVPLRI